MIYISFFPLCYDILKTLKQIRKSSRFWSFFYEIAMASKSAFSSEQIAWWVLKLRIGSVWPVGRLLWYRPLLLACLIYVLSVHIQFINILATLKYITAILTKPSKTGLLWQFLKGFVHKSSKIQNLLKLPGARKSILLLYIVW